MNQNLLDILMCPLTGSELTLTPLESLNGHTEFGVLSGDGGEYPVICGIPILKTGQSELVSLLRAGQYPRATAQAAVGAKYVPVLTHFMQAGPLRRRLRTVTKPLEARLRERWLDTATAAMEQELRGGSAQGLFEYFYRRCGGDSPEAFYYNFCRFGMPGQFVALSFTHSLPKLSGFVLDHSCGAGHLTWGLIQSVSPAQVIGQDISFFNLLAARRFTAREGLYVCTDIAKLPFRDGVFTAIFNSDAYTNFSAKLSAFEEMDRCSTPDATILLVWMRNKNRDHLYPNKPLTPEAYCRIVSGHRYRLIPDLAVIRHFLEGRGVDASAEYDPIELRHSLTLSLWIERGDRPFPTGKNLAQSVVPAELFAVNPIYARVPGGNPRRYELRYPTHFYAEEDKEMKFYYPQSFELSSEQSQAMAERSHPACLRPLLDTGALIGVPGNYLRVVS